MNEQTWPASQTWTICREVWAATSGGSVPPQVADQPPSKVAVKQEKLNQKIEPEALRASTGVDAPIKQAILKDRDHVWLSAKRIGPGGIQKVTPLSADTGAGGKLTLLQIEHVEAAIRKSSTQKGTGMTTRAAIIDVLAAKFAEGGAIAIKRGVPQAVVTEAMYRAAVAMLIAITGAEATVATLEDSAEKLKAGDSATISLAH